MGIKERRQRERQDLRESILTTAREIAASSGWQSVTIRKIANQIEYSPPTIYEYFESKDALILELVEEGFRLLVADLQAAHASTYDPEKQLIAMAHAYWEAAWNRPELYQAMNALGGVAFATPHTPTEAIKARAIVRSTIAEVVQTYGTKHPDLDDAFDIFWSNLHGLVSLTMANRIMGGQERAASHLLNQVVQNFLSMCR